MVCAFVYRSSDKPVWHNQEQTLPEPHNKNSNYIGRGYRRMDGNISVHDKHAFRRVPPTDKRQSVPSSKSDKSSHFLKRKIGTKKYAKYRKQLQQKYRKQLHSSDSLEKCPTKSKSQCTKVGESYRNNQSTADHQKLLRDENITVDRSAEEKQLPKPKLPAQNLTLGTLFDLASHLDSARKMTRRDFDSDAVTVVRQPDEGSRLLQTRPEFNAVESSVSSSADDRGDSKVDATPLQLCHTDTNCAVRLGALVAEYIEQHVDIKKLEQTAKSVSDRLRHGTAKSGEREIVCRRQPILISTVPRSASNIREKAQQANTDTDSMLQGSCVRQPTGHVAAKYHQSMLSTSNVLEPHQPSVSQKTPDTGSGKHFHMVDNVRCSNVCQSVTEGADVMTVRRIIIGRKRKTDLQLQPDNFSRADTSGCLKEDDRSDHVNDLCLIVLLFRCI